MLKPDRPRILCVDDEQHVLEALAVHLRREFDVRLATNGAEGLEVTQRDGPFAVVLSDLRMPGMDGVTFLARVRDIAPDTVRMLLTGHGSLEAAVVAVNEGQIFRFLTKPCLPEQLRKALLMAVDQYRLITAERVLLEQTLQGSIKALLDALALINPAAFGRAARIKHQVSELAVRLGVRERWPLEVAAMLSQLGYITLPKETAEKLYDGQPLAPEEQAMVARAPSVTRQLLENIPRLEPIRELLAILDKPNRLPMDPLPAQILSIAIEFDTLQARGYSSQLALDTLRSNTSRYDRTVLDALADLHGAAQTRHEMRELTFRTLQEGMVFAEDVRLKNGTLLVARGYEVTPTLLERLRNAGSGFGNMRINVIVRGL